MSDVSDANAFRCGAMSILWFGYILRFNVDIVSISILDPWFRRPVRGGVPSLQLFGLKAAKRRLPHVAAARAPQQ